MQKFSIAVFGVLALAFGIFFVSKPSEDGGDSLDRYVTPATSLSDAHGLAVDVTNPDKLLIASHSGLRSFDASKRLSPVGNATDDFMGFSPHPTNASVYYTSGHSMRVGNLGFQKSTDAGKTWTKISDGLGGPVDFHSMAVDRINPATIYGLSQGRVQKTTDEGRTWQYVPAAPAKSIQLVAGAAENQIFAATLEGLYESTDGGNTWSSRIASGLVSAVATNPTNGLELLSQSQEYGFAKSVDGGANWSKLAGPFDTDAISKIAYDSKDPIKVYGLTQSLQLYKSLDGAQTWSKLN